jgi:hypothetical protein
MISIFNPWVLLGVLIAVISSGVSGFVYGYSQADQSALVRSYDADIARLKALNTEIVRQIEAANTALESARKRQELADADERQWKDKLAQYELELSNRPVDAEKPVEQRRSCVLDDADIERLRQLGAPSRLAAPVSGDPPVAPPPR